MAKTYNDVYIEAKKRLREAGITQFGLEARLLLAYAAGKTPAELLRDLRLYCSPEFEATANGFISRRAGGEPAAYICGAWEFYGLPFVVNEDVLIPRADTEIVVEAAAELVRDNGRCRILDLCCGSGCIAVALAVSIPKIRVAAVDISPKALQTAKANAKLNNVASRVSCVCADILIEPPPVLGEFEMIICNPPYIKTNSLQELDESVRCFEPLLALDGGTDGMRFYRAVYKSWVSILKVGGYLIFECAADNAESVADAARESGLIHVDSRWDALGIERAIVLQKLY